MGLFERGARQKMSGGEGDRIKFTIPLTPTGQMRMRAAARSIRGRHVAMVYKATKQKNREAQLAAIVSYEALKNEWEKRRGPIGLKMKAFFPAEALSQSRK